MILSANLNDVCNSITSKIDHSLAAAVIDLESGLLLGVSHDVDTFTQSFLDTLAASAADMFRGMTMRNIEEMMASLRDQAHFSAAQELHFATQQTYHFMAIVPENPHILAVLVTDKQSSFGLGWQELQKMLPVIATICP